jgi:hypothetical protein
MDRTKTAEPRPEAPDARAFATVAFWFDARRPRSPRAAPCAALLGTMFFVAGPLVAGAATIHVGNHGSAQEGRLRDRRRSAARRPRRARERHLALRKRRAERRKLRPHDPVGGSDDRRDRQLPGLAGRAGAGSERRRLPRGNATRHERRIGDAVRARRTAATLSTGSDRRAGVRTPPRSRSGRDAVDDPKVAHGGRASRDGACRRLHPSRRAMPARALSRP